LRIVHLVAGVTDPAGGMHVHQMTEIDDFHAEYPWDVVPIRLACHFKAFKYF
jgi:hypothetical protein